MPSPAARVSLLGVALVTLTGCRSVLGIESTEVDPRVCTYVTQRLFFSDKPTKDTAAVVGMVTEQRFEELATSVGVTLDASRGHGLFEIVDCDDEAAERAKVSFEPEPSGETLFAVRGNGIVADDETSVEGLLGAFDLDTPNEVQITALPNEIAVASSAGDVVTRGGEVGRIRLQPNSEVMVATPDEGEWDCVGTFTDEMVMPTQITLTIDVQASAAFVPNGLPIEGVRIASCLSETASCDVGAPTPEGESAETDANGRAQIRVSTGEEGYDGHIVISGRDPACGPET